MAIVLAVLSSCLWGSADFGGGLISRRNRSRACASVTAARRRLRTHSAVASARLQRAAAAGAVDSRKSAKLPG
jgi:hypothetical protein